MSTELARILTQVVLMSIVLNEHKNIGISGNGRNLKPLFSDNRQRWIWHSGDRGSWYILI